MTVEELITKIIDLASKTHLEPHEEETLHEYRKHLPKIKPFFRAKETYDSAREAYIKASGVNQIPRNPPCNKDLLPLYEAYIDALFAYTDESRKRV